MNGEENAHSRWSFHQRAFPLRIFLILFVSFLLIITAFGQYATARIADYLTYQARESLLRQAKIIASDRRVINAVQHREPLLLRGIIMQMSDISDAHSVVIGDNHFIILYHANPARIGSPMQHLYPGKRENEERYFIIVPEETGVTSYAHIPIFDAERRDIGMVSLTFRQHRIKGWCPEILRTLAGGIVLTLSVMLVFAWMITVYIRRQMLNMEPGEFARIVHQQETLSELVIEGLISVDRNGLITALNGRAKKMIDLSSPGKQWLGCPVDKLLHPESFFSDDGEAQWQDVNCTLNGLNVIANRRSIRCGGKTEGTLVSFRREDEISTLNAQLNQIKQQAQNLRTLRHEHLNWISTIGGLLHMKEYDRALAMVNGESRVQQTLIDSLRRDFTDRHVAGLIYGKAQRARESGLQLILVEGSQLQQLPERLSSIEFAAIVGNLLDNAIEASLRKGEDGGRVELFISDEGKETIIEVADWGTGVPQDLQSTIFQRGFSSKSLDPGEHGIGLYLVASYVARCGGVITLEDNDPCGTLFSIFIPKVKSNDGL